MWTKLSAVLTGTIGQTALGALIGVAAYNGAVALYDKVDTMIAEHKAKTA